MMARVTMSKTSGATREIRLHPEWLEALGDEFEQPYMQELRAFLLERKQAGAAVYPPGGQIFNALDTTPPSKVKAVILGQDPYHGPGQAHGLCFSVRHGVRTPPSLANIHKELESDIGLAPPGHGNLEAWARRGVLLLNTTLTVRGGQAGSHAGKGWETFTDRVISVVNDKPDHVVFVLWGNHARRKRELVDTTRHTVVESPHPSPFSANNGFFGSRPFSAVNEALHAHGQTPIDWSL